MTEKKGASYNDGRRILDNDRTWKDDNNNKVEKFYIINSMELRTIKGGVSPV